jgi:hypothetical protein
VQIYIFFKKKLTESCVFNNSKSSILEINFFFKNLYSVFGLKNYFCHVNDFYMKKFLSLILVAVALSSCQEDVKFNSPALQGLKDNVLWRANDVRAYISSNGQLSIVGLTEYEELVLNTNSTNVGTYNLGSTIQNNNATYTSDFNDNTLVYSTISSPGPVADINLPLINAGSGYLSATSVATATTGSGTGLKVNVAASGTGAVTRLTISARGNGYSPGDIITVVGGNSNCRFRVSIYGEVKITEFDDINMTVSGSFKFDARNVDDNPLGGPILNYQYGAFYKVSVFPSE